MVALILGMLICVALALAVVALVAVPARRHGRDVLTPKGEDVVSALKDRQQAARQRFERGESGESGESEEATEGASPGEVNAGVPAAEAPAPTSSAPAASVDPTRS